MGVPPNYSSLIKRGMYGAIRHVGGKKSLEAVAVRANAGGFVVAVLEPGNGIVSLHVTWVNEMERLVRPLPL